MTQITNYLSNHRIVVALIYIVVCWLLLQMIESVYRHALPFSKGSWKPFS